MMKTFNDQALHTYVHKENVPKSNTLSPLHGDLYVGNTHVEVFKPSHRTGSAAILFL